MNAQTLTNKTVRGLPLTLLGQKRYSDTTTGFTVLVGKRTRTYYWNVEVTYFHH